MNANTSLGKRVVDDLYLHLSTVEQALEAKHCRAVQALLARIGTPEFEPNVVKVNLRDGRISLLSYPDFQESAFPQLAASWTQSVNGELRYRVYSESLNPPILHRKELLVPEDWPERGQWELAFRLLGVHGGHKGPGNGWSYRDGSRLAPPAARLPERAVRDH